MQRPNGHSAAQGPGRGANGQQPAPAKPHASTFDAQAAREMLSQRYAEAKRNPELVEHKEKLQSAWGNKVRRIQKPTAQAFICLLCGCPSNILVVVYAKHWASACRSALALRL